MSRILTLETLKLMNACYGQALLFQELFGDSVEITPELCIKHANDFDYNWAARNLLSKTGYDKYLIEKNAAWDKYRSEKNAAWDKFRATGHATSNKYLTEENVALDKYRAERHAAYDKYCAAFFSSLANAYINDDVES